jgi:hypothetical protein
LFEKLKKKIKYRQDVARQDSYTSVYYQRIHNAGREEAFKEVLELIDEVIENG